MGLGSDRKMLVKSIFLKEEKEQMERVVWCDIYKGVATVLVVIGHATGSFNQYIYQFHMAAFFFISGYTGNVYNCGFFQKVVQKFYKLMFPYLSIGLAGIWLFWIFDRIGILNWISGTYYPESFQSALTAFFKLEFTCDWLGAMWFLPVLFFAEMIFYIIANSCRKNFWIVLLSVSLYFYGLRLSASGATHYSIDLACIAQVFYMYGYLIKKVPDKRINGWYMFFSSFLLLAAWMFAIKSGFTYTVDWPVRKWNGAVDLVLPVLGILLTINIAKWIERNQYGKKVFLYLGRNSMGIMCFHFIGFKVFYLVCILLRVMTVDEICSLTPPEYVSKRYWVFFVLTALIVSCTFWNLLINNPVIRLMLGCERVEKVSNRLFQIKIVKGVETVCQQVFAMLKAVLLEYITFFQYLKYTAIFCTVLAFIVWGFSSFGKIEATFPYRGALVKFEEGWLAQNDAEPYRWIQKKATFQVFLTRQDELTLTGYIPENIEQVSYVSIKVNGKEVAYKAAVSGQNVEIQADLSKAVHTYRKNIFDIQTDGMRVPKETEADQRSFSMLVQKIRID